MVIFLNLDGSCENVSPQRVFQGSNNVTDITVVAPYANSMAMQIGFILPNGLYWQNETDGARYMPMEFIKQDVTTKANVWRYTLQGSVTEQVGELYIAINALTNDGNTTSYMIRQDIEESVLPNLPSAPEPSVYELLQLYISRLDGRTANVPNLVASIQKVKGASNAFTYTDNSGVESAPIVIGGGEDAPIPVNTASTVSIPASAWQPVYAADGTTVTGYTYTITASMHGQMRDQTQAKNLWVSFDEVAGTEYNPDYTGVFAEYKVNIVGDITISVSKPVAMTVRVWNGKGLRGETGNNGQDGASIVGVRTIGSEVIAPGTQTRTYLVPVIKQGAQTWDGEQFYVTVKNGEEGNAIRYIQQGRTETVGSMTRTYFTVVYTKSAREEFYVDAAMGTPGRDGRNGRGVMNLRVTGVSESDGYTVNTVRQDFTDGSHYDMEIKAKNGEDVEARAAIAAETERAEDVENQMKEKISGIESVIPTTATEENKLADQAFVNSSINNMAAFYITSNAQGDAFPTRESLLTAETYYYGGEPRVPTQNDYAIVLADESQPKGANDSYPTTRYSYQGTGWSFQYVVNNTSLTQAQINAINSGITKEIVDGLKQGGVTGVKGAAETVYKTGNVNLTPENIGSVNKAGDTMTGSLEITGTNPGGWSLKATGDVGGDRLYEGDVRVYSPNNLPAVVKDSGDGRDITFGYSKAGVPWNQVDWLAGWVDGHEIRAITKPTASDIGAEPALRETVIDATGLDENTWYPVTIPLWTNKLCTIEIRNALHDGNGNPSWSTHAEGFSAFAKWSVRGNGWGATAQNRAIREITWSFADNVFGEIGQLSHSSNEYIYVRGGAKYHFHCSEGAGTPILRTSTFTQSEESISPTTTHSMNYMLNAIDTGQVNAEIYDNKQRVFSPNNPQAYLPSVNGNVSLQYNGFWTSSSEPPYVMVGDSGSPLPMKYMHINSNFYTAQRPFGGKRISGTVSSGGQITNPTNAVMIVTIWATETSQYGTLEIRDVNLGTRAAYVEGEHAYWGANTLCITAVIQGGHNAMVKGSKVGTINYSAVCLSYN